MKTLTIELDDETATIVEKLGGALSTSSEAFAAECVETWIGQIKDGQALELEATARVYDTLEEAKACVEACKELDGSRRDVLYFEDPEGRIQPEYCLGFISERRKQGWKELVVA